MSGRGVVILSPSKANSGTLMGTDHSSIHGLLSVVCQSRLRKTNPLNPKVGSFGFELQDGCWARLTCQTPRSMPTLSIQM